MKPDTRASLRIEGLARATRRLVQWIGVGLVMLASSTALWAAPPVVHYTSADMLREEGASFRPLAATVDDATLPGPWVKVSLPHVIERPVAPDGGNAPLVTSWFRIPLDGLQGRREAMHFYLVRWLAAGQIAVYEDGRLIYRSEGSPVWNLFNHPALLLPLNPTADSALPKVLLIRLDSLPAPGAAISSFYAGDSDHLVSMANAREWLAYQLPFMCSAAFLAVGFFALAVWVRRRDTPYLLVFVIALCGSIRRWHFHLGLEKLPVSDAWFIWLTLNALMWQLVCIHFFAQHLHGQKMRRTGLAMLALGLTFSFITLPVLSVFDGALAFRPYAHVVLISLGALVTALALCHSWRSRSVDALLLTGALLVTFVFGTYDWARLRYVQDLESYYLTPYAAMLLFAVFAIIMFRRYVGALGEVEQLNSGLEQRLASREAELAASYDKLRDIEQRQTLSKERQRLTQDMHDGLGSSLVSALRVVEGGQLGQVDVAAVLKSCIDDLRLTIDSLEPVDADLLLLLATLRFRLGPRLAAAGIALRWEVSEVPALDWLDPRTSLHILRILQESITNILRHTRATDIRVATALAGQGVEVTIEDNGGGFDVDKTLADCSGRGLANQQRRAESIDSTVAWQSSSAGTRFVLWLPLSRKVMTA
jgi:signal transduction histidine kinase